jgi:hypothetical protein
MSTTVESSSNSSSGIGLTMDTKKVAEKLILLGSF